jgi:transcription initiation factor TFIIIB Brf1 subunit/transcription initiation factor TFIIB
MFLHRFYMRFSLREYHYYDIGATSLFLATKCDENVKSLRSIVVECCKTAQKNEQLIVDEQSKEYWRWRDVLLYNEELLLEALCFDLVIAHPYQDLRQYWKRLGGGTELRKCAWAFVNDAYRTRVVLMYKPHIIAAAALYFGSVFTGTQFAETEGEPWWQTLNVDLAQCEEVVMVMIELFETAPNLVNNGIDFKDQAKKGGEAVKLLDEAKKHETGSKTSITENGNGNGNGAKHTLPSPAGTLQPDVKKLKEEAEATPVSEVTEEDGELKE